MTRHTQTAAGAIALVVAIASVAVGAPTADLAGAAQQEAQQPGIVVDRVVMPPLATPGRFDVEATVRNPGTANRTGDVAFRFEGGPHDVVIAKRVTVPANSTRRVSFSLNTTGFPLDDYIAGVTTARSSELEEVALSTTAAVDFDSQETDGTTVVVDSVFLPSGGYVVLHNDSLAAGDAVGSVVGTSGYLAPGFHREVAVELFDVPGARYSTTRLTADEQLVAMAHQETTGNRAFEFVRSDGTTDGPALDEGQPVTDAANVTVAGPGTSTPSPGG